MKYKIIFIDLDGTLLTTTKRISERNKNAIKKAAEKGVKIVITTGRLWNNAALYSKKLNIKAPVIGANGAVIKDWDNTVIYKSVFDINQCKAIDKILNKYKVFYNAHTVNSIYSNGNLPMILTKLYMHNQKKFRGLEVNVEKIKGSGFWDKIEQDTEKYVVKFVAFCPSANMMEKAKRELNRIKGVAIYSSGLHNIEINKKEDCKGNAVKMIMNKFQVNRDEIICIGDNENDISMIKYAGLGIAMGNSISEVKDAADCVTLSNNKNGVALAIEKYILEEYDEKINSINNN